MRSSGRELSERGEEEEETKGEGVNSKENTIVVERDIPDLGRFAGELEPAGDSFYSRSRTLNKVRIVCFSSPFEPCSVFFFFLSSALSVFFFDIKC